MGNKASIEIQVHWDETDGVVTAGKDVEGMVLLNIPRPIYGGKVRLILYGKEKTSIHTRIGGTSETFRSERSLITVYQTLKDFPLYTKIPKGCYRLPFKVLLPATIPSSQRYPASSKKPSNGFRIQYKLLASLGKIEQSTYLCVRSAPLSCEPLPCMIQPTSIPISTLKLFKEGEVTVGASVTDIAVGRGENIELRLACRNESKIDIRRVEIKLVETVKWTVEAQGMTRESSQTLVRLRDVELPTLSKYRKDRSEVRRLAKDSSQREVMYQAIYDDLVSGRHKVNVFVPEDSRDSYDGQVVIVAHTLEVKLQTRGISSNALTSIPIRVGTPRHNSAEQASVPFEPNIPIATGIPSNEIPVAQATQVNPVDEEDDDVQSVIVLSSDAVLPAHSSLEDLVPLEPPPFSADVSLPTLLQRMRAAMSSYSFLSSLLLETPWVRFFCAMSASDYASIIRHTFPVADQPRVAALLAEYVNGGDELTCAWAAAAVQATNPHYKSATLQRLVPLCTDIKQNHNMLRQELSAWEQTVTEKDFRLALERARFQ